LLVQANADSRVKRPYNNRV